MKCGPGRPRCLGPSTGPAQILIPRGYRGRNQASDLATFGRAGLSLRMGWESRSLGGGQEMPGPLTVRQTATTGAPFSQQGKLSMVPAPQVHIHTRAALKAVG